MIESESVKTVIGLINRLANESFGPIVVAMDGRSGSGKSTLAKYIANQVNGIEIETDVFWAGGSKDEWDARTPKERSELAIDWKRLKQEAIEPLLNGKKASWKSAFSDELITRNPSKVIIIDGAYSTRPELEDVLDLKILVEVPEDSHRRSRLIDREGREYMTDWHKRWDPAEDYYFSEVRPRSTFDAIILNQ